MLPVRLIADDAVSQDDAKPVAYLRIEGLLLEMPSEAVATYCEGLWFRGDHGIRTVLIDGPAHIRAIDEFGHGVLHGPFRSIRIVDGLIHISRSKWKPFARLDSRNALWHIGSDATAWPTLEFTAAGQLGVREL